MYTAESVARARKRMWTRIAWLALVVIIALGACVCGYVLRIRALAIGAAVIGSAVFYTILVAKALPWVRYCRFLREVTEGRHRETECFFVDIADRVRVVDGVQIHDVNCAVDEKCEDLRLFYWDADLPLPTATKGQRVQITSWGNFILEMTVVEC